MPESELFLHYLVLSARVEKDGDTQQGNSDHIYEEESSGYACSGLFFSCFKW